MSYSSTAKETLTKKKLHTALDYQAVILAATASIGTITLRRGRGMGIKFTTELHQVAKLLAKCAQSVYNVDSELAIHEVVLGKASRNTVLTLFGQDTEKILCEAGILSSDAIWPVTFAEKQKRLYLRGSFLACGSITDPNKSYHLELVCRNEAAHNIIIEYAKEFDIQMKYSKRKDNHIVYIKDSDSISRFMSAIGATDAALQLESVKAYRDKVNYVTRIYNCDIANIQRTQTAAQKQIDEITFLLSQADIDLPESLKETAKARLENPEASLSELAAILGIGKSGANHRIQKLLELAKSRR